MNLWTQLTLTESCSGRCACGVVTPPSYQFAEPQDGALNGEVLPLLSTSQ